MANKYFFDKRVMKRGGLKYLIIFLISFLPLILFNVFIGKYIVERWLVILLDCVLLLVFVVIGNAIANRIYDKKDRKLEARIKAREEMNERKRQILEDSYNRKRIEKQKLKKEKEEAENKSSAIEIKNSNIVIDDNAYDEGSIIIKRTKKKSANTKNCVGAKDEKDSKQDK